MNSHEFYLCIRWPNCAPSVSILSSLSKKVGVGWVREHERYHLQNSVSTGVRGATLGRRSGITTTLSLALIQYMFF